MFSVLNFWTRISKKKKIFTILLRKCNVARLYGEIFVRLKVRWQSYATLVCQCIRRRVNDQISSIPSKLKGEARVPLSNPFVSFDDISRARKLFGVC